MPPLESAKEFIVQLIKLGMRDQFSALPAAYQKELYDWVQAAPTATDRLSRLEKLRSKLLT